MLDKRDEKVCQIHKIIMNKEKKKETEIRYRSMFAKTEKTFGTHHSTFHDSKVAYLVVCFNLCNFINTHLFAPVTVKML